MPLIFSLSARQGLQAKQSGDQVGLEESGLAAFESELLRFLTEERAQAFVANLYARTTTLLVRRSRPENGAEQQNTFGAMVERLRTLRKTSFGTDSASKKSVISEDESSKTRIRLQFEKRCGCQICGAVLEAIFQFLSKYQYELTINPEVQREHAIRGGFCPLHTWQYENEGPGEN